jgi:hypothetical protein
MCKVRECRLNASVSREGLVVAYTQQLRTSGFCNRQEIFWPDEGLCTMMLRMKVSAYAYRNTNFQ